jgi:putative membrane protein
MTALNWALRFIIVSFLIVFAIQNTELVILRVMPGYFWEAPLVVVLLAFFAAGAILGVLSVLGIIYRQRREVVRLKRELGKVIEPTKPLSAPNV